MVVSESAIAVVGAVDQLSGRLAGRRDGRDGRTESAIAVVGAVESLLSGRLGWLDVTGAMVVPESAIAVVGAVESC